jgi:hypothetical protein
VAVGVDEQSKAVPDAKFALLGIVPSVARTSISITPAVQAASAAVCADWRLNHVLLRSIANAIAPIRNSPKASSVKSMACPASFRLLEFLTNSFVFMALHLLELIQNPISS